MNKKKNFLGTTITVSTVVVGVLLQIFASTIGFLWRKLLDKIWKKPGNETK